MNKIPVNRSSFIVHRSSFQSGFTLIELVITITVLSVLVLSAIPLVQNAVRRQKEQQLREALREIRLAVDEFHRDANGICTTNQAGGAPNFSDPRSRVMISDCKIFETENLDKYPPTLETLVEGVMVQSRNPGGGNADKTTAGRVFDRPDGATGGGNATEKGGATDQVKKVYLRELPVDPFTGKPFSCDDESVIKCRSPYQEKDGSWDRISIFDVRSTRDGESLTGEKYSDF